MLTNSSHVTLVSDENKRKSRSSPHNCYAGVVTYVFVCSDDGCCGEACCCGAFGPLEVCAIVLVSPWSLRPSLHLPLLQYCLLLSWLRPSWLCQPWLLLRSPWLLLFQTWFREGDLENVCDLCCVGEIGAVRPPWHFQLTEQFVPDCKIIFDMEF